MALVQPLRHLIMLPDRGWRGPRRSHLFTAKKVRDVKSYKQSVCKEAKTYGSVVDHGDP